MNFFFQKFFAIPFNFASTDFTYAFRIYPTALVQASHWEKLSAMRNIHCEGQP